MAARVGKNHVGDRNEFLPTVHGFDEFFGNRYHLNAEEEPEQADYLRDHPAFQNLFKPHGVLDCKATDADDASENCRFGRVGEPTIRDTGPLTRKRMEPIEEESLARSLDFIDRSHAADKPFLLWHNTTRMHVWSRLAERWRDKTRFGVCTDGTQKFDWVVGELLEKVDKLGIAENAIVVFTTDNGAEKFSWPDGGTSPFRGEMGLGWEGGFRAPFSGRPLVSSGFLANLDGLRGDASRGSMLTSDGRCRSEPQAGFLLVDRRCQSAAQDAIERRRRFVRESHTRCPAILVASRAPRNRRPLTSLISFFTLRCY
jgi:hypothetical protein